MSEASDMVEHRNRAVEKERTSTVSMGAERVEGSGAWEVYRGCVVMDEGIGDRGVWGSAV